MFYVYEWYIVETGEIFYVGKGCKNRYKSKCHRNRLFDEFIKRFNCESRIIKRFDTEDEAFCFEKERIAELKAKGLCVCNLDGGGNGGVNFVWTDDMRKYKSVYNPMKAKAQRERMSKNNPMKRPDIAAENGKRKMRPVVINGTWYESLKSAAKSIGVCEFSILTWCKRGYDTVGNPCRYANEEQKPYPTIKKTHPGATTPKSVIVDGIKFETVKDAAKFINTHSERLIRAIKSNRKCKGHECRYDNQQPSRGNSDTSTPEGSTTNG